MKLFNKGIYRATVKRFWWTSVMYFVLLLFATGGYLLSAFQSYAFYDGSGAEPYALAKIMDFGMMVTIVMSTVFGLQVYGFLHSKKQAIFTHSLPVGRNAHFISSALAGFTLMAAPILLNGLILIGLAMTEYVYGVFIRDALVWTAITLAEMFVLFAYSTFAAVITGNAFAAAALNLSIFFIHPYLLMGADGLAECFLFGYVSDNALLDNLFSWNPLSWGLIEVGNHIHQAFNDAAALSVQALVRKSLIQMAMAVVVYVFSFVLYRKRKIERVGEVAGFAWIAPVFKYGLTFFSTVMVFIISMEADEIKPLVTIVTCVVISAVVYFALEAALKKSFKIWKSYKGYLGFAALFAVMLSALVNTSFFGFETRVPANEDVECVAISCSDSLKDIDYFVPFSYDTEIAVAAAVGAQNRILRTTPDRNRCFAGKGSYEDIYITYYLKNGTKIERKYGITEQQKREIIHILYAVKDYKNEVEQFYMEFYGDVWARSILDRIEETVVTD